AGRTPVHFRGGCGGRQRSAPTGGAAKGTPRNTITPLAESTTPSMVPVSIVTRVEPALSPPRRPGRIAQATIARRTVEEIIEAALPSVGTLLSCNLRTEAR